MTGVSCVNIYELVFFMLDGVYEDGRGRGEGKGGVLSIYSCLISIMVYPVMIFVFFTIMMRCM